MSFTARYPGSECVVCEEPIYVGQHVEFNDNRELMHVLCPTSISSGKPRPVCPRCFLEMVGDDAGGWMCGYCDE